MKEICAQYDLPFVADEVICGFGRTGHWFGSDLYGLKPDLMPMAKRLSSGYLPIGGVMVSDRVANVLIDQGGEFNHGYTYSGHPVCAAVAVANIRLMQKEKIVETVHDSTAPYLQKRIRELGEHALVGEVRGIGMLGAIELVEDKAGYKKFHKDKGVGVICREHCFDNGLVMRAVGDTMIMSPPLIMQISDIDTLLERAWKSLDLTLKDLA